MNAMKGAFPGRLSHRTLCALIAGVLLGAVSYSHPHSSETSEKAPSPPVEIKDPIITIITASSIDAEGELKPVSIEQQDQGPDQQLEIVTYKGSRGIKPPVAMHVPGDGNWATEHIEIRQVRELKLVPRV
jgi:hypothetical protein